MEYTTTKESGGKQVWKLPELTLEYVHEKLERLRKSKSNCFSYAWGCWITAEARKRLWNVIKECDNEVIYYDTDSVKYFPSDHIREVIEAENKRVWAVLNQTCRDLEINPELLNPADPDGVRHPLGMWEDEVKSYASEFITLGAKRYAYRTKRDGKLHCVVSGVNNKTGYKALNDDIHNFNKSLIFDYEAAGKLTSYYRDDQPVIIYKDYLGQVYRSTQRHGICLLPTIYSMTVTPQFEAYIEETQNGFKGGEWIC